MAKKHQLEYEQPVVEPTKIYNDKTFKKDKRSRKTSTMRRVNITKGLAVIIAVLLTVFVVLSMTQAQDHTLTTKPISSVLAESEPVSVETSEAVVNTPEPEKTPQSEPVQATEQITWRDNPNNCDLKTQYVWASDFSCHDKPVGTSKSTVGTSADKGTTSTPTSGSGNCYTEAAKYDWNYNVAKAVINAESGGRPGVVNNNPRTKDYSVGCFQINLYGANAKSRPSEAWLKVASNNVSYAYQIYVNNGRSFWGQWGACRTGIGCY